MFGIYQKKVKNTENVVDQSRKVWKEKLSSFEKVIACFLFGQILNLLYDLLGIGKSIKYHNPFFQEVEEKYDEKSHIFFTIDPLTKTIIGKDILFKFQNDIKQKTENK